MLGRYYRRNWSSFSASHSILYIMEWLDVLSNLASTNIKLYHYNNGHTSNVDHQFTKVLFSTDPEPLIKVPQQNICWLFCCAVLLTMTLITFFSTTPSPSAASLAPILSSSSFSTDSKKIPASCLGPSTGGGFYEYSSLLCLLVTALSFTTTAGSDKLKEFARVGVFSTAITKFNWVNCWKHNILQQKCVLFGLFDIFARQILCVELSPHVKYNSRYHFIRHQQVCRWFCYQPSSNRLLS